MDRREKDEAQQQDRQQPPPVAEALAAANALLISSLAAGSIPYTDDAQLMQHITAYRGSIGDLSRQLEHLAPNQPGLQTQQEQQQQLQQQQLQQQQQQQQADLVAAGAEDADTAAVIPDLGEEGVDYTVGSADDLDPSEWQVPPHCVPIHANVTTFDWSKLYQESTFDVIMMDPPWQLATANPTRGVALGYSQLTDHDICQLPIPQLQQSGFLFVWVINSKYTFTLQLFEKWGYRLVDEIVWVKMTVNRRLAKSHGYYLQHAKEVCMVAVKHPDPAAAAGSIGGAGAQQQSAGRAFAALSGRGVGSDVIFSERRGQSQKPEEIYKLVEQLVPGGRYLEIFARKNNLRNFWVSIGNEVTGTGLPEEDMEAFKKSNYIPGAVYGRGGTAAPVPGK